MFFRNKKMDDLESASKDLLCESNVLKAQAKAMQAELTREQMAYAESEVEMNGLMSTFNLEYKAAGESLIKAFEVCSDAREFKSRLGR